MPTHPFSGPVGKKVILEKGTINFSSTVVANTLYDALPEFSVAGTPAAGSYSIETNTPIHANLIAILGKVTPTDAVGTAKIKTTGAIVATTSSGLIQDFVVPKHIELTVSADTSTFKNNSDTAYTDKKFNLIVDGTLIFAGDTSGNEYSLEPSGNVEINGGLLLGSEALSKITILADRTLTIADPAKLVDSTGTLGKGKFVLTASALPGSPPVVVKIGEVDYTVPTPSIGFVAGGLKGTIDEINNTKGLFTDAISLDSGVFSSFASASTTKVSGTIDIAATGPVEVIAKGNPSAGLGVLPSLTVPAGAGVLVVPANGAANFLTGSSSDLDQADFAISSNSGTGVVQIADSDVVVSGGATRVGILRFTNLQFTYGNLRWLEDEFHIGIRTLR
jgi:hypothetical protein